MHIDTEDLISITEANNQGISKLVADAETGRYRVLVRNNRAVAAIVDLPKLERLQRLDELEDDIRLLTIALARAAADSGRRIPLDDVLTRAGIKRDELDDED